MNNSISIAVIAALNGETGLTREEPRDCLKGAEKVKLLGVKSVFRLSRPIPLKKLRHRNRRMVIPQSYRLLDDSEIKALAPHIGV